MVDVDAPRVRQHAALLASARRNAPARALFFASRQLRSVRQRCRSQRTRSRARAGCSASSPHVAAATVQPPPAAPSSPAAPRAAGALPPPRRPSSGRPAAPRCCIQRCTCLVRSRKMSGTERPVAALSSLYDASTSRTSGTLRRTMLSSSGIRSSSAVSSPRRSHLREQRDQPRRPRRRTRSAADTASALLAAREGRPRFGGGVRARTWALEARSQAAARTCADGP